MTIRLVKVGQVGDVPENAMTRFLSPEVQAQLATLDRALEGIAEEQEALAAKRTRVRAQYYQAIIACGFVS